MTKVNLMRWLMVLLTLGSISAFGQSLEKVDLYKLTQVSPNAAALGKFGEYPVGLYTGIPGIDLPFYEITSGRIKVPIGISYSGGGGIRVEEMASSVGLGWALNSGGVITRSVKGLPDEQMGAGGINFLNTTLTVDSLEKRWNNPPSLNDTAMIKVLKRVIGMEIDAEPDVFHFNFAGRSGKFMYNQKDGKFYSLPYSKLVISANASLGEFSITDENGLIYTFDQKEVSTRGLLETVTVTTAWYLTSISDPVSMRSVTFSYVSKTIYYETMGSQTHYFNENLVEASGSKQDLSHATTRPKHILFDNNKVEFIYGLPRTDLPGDSALTEVKIYDSKNNLIKDFDLGYSYFHSTDYVASAPSDTYYRLKLQTLSEYSTDGNHNNPKTHTFEYVDTIPNRLSFAQDHWGFFNNEANTVLYPPFFYDSHFVTTLLAGANRNVSASAARAGSIKKITYPTKGYTTFEFESNTSSSLEAPMLDRSTGATIPLGETDYAEGNFTILSLCGAGEGAYVSASIAGFNNDYMPSGWPGLVLKVSIQDLLTNTVSEVFWIESGKGGTFDPVLFYLPNGNYKMIIDCVGNPYTDAYYNMSVVMTWNECPPYTNFETNNRLVGGLRIKKIKNYDEDGNLATMKYYKYVKEDNHSASSGQSVFYPRYFDWVSYTANLSATSPRTCLRRMSQSNYPLVDDGGKGVGYSNVIELNWEDDTKGYTQYKFTNFSEYPDGPSGNIRVSRPIAHNWLRGLETERKVFKFNGTSNELLSSIVNEYDTTLLGSLKKSIKGIRGVYTWIAELSSEAVWPGEDYVYLGAIIPNWEVYPTFVDFVYLKKTTERLYDATNYVENIKNFTYNNRNLSLSLSDAQTSDGQRIVQQNKYPLDFTVTGATHPRSIPIKNMQDMNMIMAPIEQYVYKVLPNNDKLLLGANYHSYVGTDAHPRIDTIFTYDLPNTPVLNYTGITATPSTFSKSSNYRANVVVESYDPTYINIAQQKKLNGPSQSYLWDYEGNYLVAEVIGAVQSDIAYTSFEAQDHGNWTYNGTISADATSPTGKNAYALTTSNTVSKTGLNSGTRYVLSYWAKNTTSNTISGYTANLIETRNGWSRYDVQFTGASSITLSGTVALDEVRLHPVGALMSTSTYDVLVGMNSKTDSKGMITYYEYDEHKRLKCIKNEKGEILKAYAYHFKP